MAESYQTEEEQVEALKKWWKENGKSTIITIVVAIAAVYGWRGWQGQQQTEIEAASAVYQNLLSVSDGNLTAEQLTTAHHLVDTLKQDFPKSTYAHFGALYKAKFAVEKNDLEAAEKELRWVLETDTSLELTLQTKLRLARVLSAQDKYDEALAQLSVDASGYAAAFEEVKGDIYLAQEKTSQARLAYQKATELGQQEEGERPVRSSLLNMKLQQLNSD
ncbi:MAG: tetratricopeptide repeat protein [Pseudomonadales bacterium]